MSKQRNGDWIETYTGGQFWPLDPRPEDVWLGDIAHALSQLCRFTGHSRLFYSVAQHAVLVSQGVPERHALWGLMHDAAEAYVADIARPVKQYLIARYLAPLGARSANEDITHQEMYASISKVEERILRTVAERFDLPWPVPECVGIADLRMLATEKRDVMRSLRDWGSIEGVEPYEDCIECLEPFQAERLFLERFRDLTEEPAHV